MSQREREKQILKFKLKFFFVVIFKFAFPLSQVLSSVTSNALYANMNQLKFTNCLVFLFLIAGNSKTIKSDFIKENV